MSDLVITDKPSPNFNDRPQGMGPDLVVVHGTTGSDAGDLDWLTRAESRVSYHYLVQRCGTIWRLVPENKRAWHAGKSEWRGRGDCNSYSIGIGFSNRGPAEPFTEEQYIEGGILIGEILRRYQLPMRRVVGHCHVSPGRKTDPWLHMEWGHLLEIAARTRWADLFRRAA